MSSVNKVIIVGNLGRDPETRSFPNGDLVANVTIATTDRYKEKTSGEMKEITEWHRVSFFGRLAEVVAQYLRKGSQVYVEGSLRTRKCTDKDGIEKYSTEIRADQMQMLGTKGGEQRQKSAAPRRTPTQPGPAATVNKSGFDDMDSDIPFVTSAFDCDTTTSKARRMARYNY